MEMRPNRISVDSASPLDEVRGVPVTVAPVAGEQRTRLTMPAGLTVQEMVRLALPGLPEQALGRVNVWLVNENGQSKLEPEAWRRWRPLPTTHVLIRLVPAGKFLQTALSILVSVAAAALGQFWLGPILQGFGLSAGVATALASTGLALAGNFLLSFLFKPAEAQKEKPVYQLAGMQNEARPLQPFPVIFGKHRYAPPFMARTYFEIANGRMYQRFLVGLYGPNKVRDIRIGDTPIGKYQDCETEVREGWETDDPVTLYDHQVIPTPENGGVQLVRPLPRDEFGEVIAGATPEVVWVERQAAVDATELEAIIVAQSGMQSVNDDGDLVSIAVNVRLRQREVGTEEWETVKNWRLSGKQRETLFFTHRWTVPDRNKRWEVGIARITPERTSASANDNISLLTLQSHRPEYPINYTRPLTLIAGRIKATHQLNGMIDRLNAEFSSILPDWDAATETWIKRETASNAAAFRAALQGPFVLNPLADSEIDLDGLADWAEFLTAKGLSYNRVHDFEESQPDMLEAIAAAGRASPHDDGRRQGVLIDRPQTAPIEHVNQSNSRNFSLRHPYFRPPEGYRISFPDAANGYKVADRIVPWPGFVGDPIRTEELRLPGITDAALIWREARRRQYAAIHRSEIVNITQDKTIRAATRGDLVMGAWDTLDGRITVTVVEAVNDRHVTLADPAVMEEGQDYALRFVGIEQLPGYARSISVVRRVRTVAGKRRALVVTGDGQMPKPGDLIHFGLLGQDSMPLVICGIEPGEAMSQRLTLQPHAPEIDALTDAEVAPPWNGRVGEIRPPSTAKPAAPRFVSIGSGVAGTGTTGRVAVELQTGTGVGSAIAVRLFRLSHRPAGGAWTVLDVDPGDLAELNYVNGDAIELQATAVSYSGVESDPTGVVALTIGAGDAPLPAALNEASITITAKPGHIEIIVANADVATTKVQIWRDGAKLGPPIAIAAGATGGKIDGDSTRVNLFANPDMASDTAWTKPTGLTIASGKATKTAGTAGTLSQAPTLEAGAQYRIGVTISGYSAGTIRAQLTDTVRAAGWTSNGVKGAVLTAPAAPHLAGFYMSSTTAAAFTGAMLYRATPACIAQGLHTYEIQPLNDDDVAGPMSAARAVFAI